MEIKSLTDYFSVLYNRSLGIFFGSIVLAMVLFYLQLSGNQPVILNSPFQWVLCLLAFMDGLISFYVVAISLRKKVQPVMTLNDRLHIYSKYNTVHFAILFVGSVLILVAFYLSETNYVLLAYTLYLSLFYYAWPTRLRVCNKLPLTEDERQKILNEK